MCFTPICVEFDREYLPPTGGTLALGHETTPIGEIHPAGHAGWSRVGVPGWVPLDLTLDSNDLTRLHGFDAREAGGRERQQVFQTVRLRAENDNCDLAGS